MLRYEDFIIESSTKGMQLYYSDQFRNILKFIYEKYNGTAERVAGVLILQETGGQSKYPYSLIDITDKNDKVSFVQANRYLKVHPDGERPDKTNKYWSEGRTPEYAIGKFAQMVMKNVDKEVPGAELELFVNAYRTEYDLAQKGDSHTFEVVKGAEIEKRYLESSFVNKSDYTGNDSLHGSCMRKPGCAGFFNIYIENPDVCELLVMLDKEGKTMGRALLWTLDDGKRYMDRVYCVDTNTNVGKFYDWGKTNKIDYYYGLTPVAPADATVVVKGKEYKYYPYMDTFKYYDTEEGTLTKSVPTNTEYVLYLQSTQGGGPLLEEEFRWSNSEGEWLDIDNSCYCSDIDDYVSSDFAIWLEYIGEYVSDRAETRYCEYDGNTYLEEDSVESVMMNDWIPKEDAIKVITSTSGNGDWDWCHIGEKSLYVEVDNKYYSKEYTFDPYTEEWTFDHEEVFDKLRKEYVENGVAKSSSGKFDKAKLRQDTRKMLIDWKGYLTSLPDFVAELFEGVPYEYTVYADIGLDSKDFVNTGITDLVPAFIEYLVNGFDARSEGSVANIAHEIYGDETIEPKLKSSRNLSDSDVKVKVRKAKLAASCFKENSNIGLIFGKVSMPKLLEMPKPGEDLYKRWILLRRL
jgi:hypothetical protein